MPETVMNKHVKANLPMPDGGMEGMWVFVDDVTHARYRNDMEQGSAEAILANESIQGHPWVWGARVVIRFQGRERPIIERILEEPKP